MTIIKHELRQGRRMLAIWTAGIGFFIAVCVFMFPEMNSQMESVSRIFAAMGAFTAAFGMDKLNFGTLIGFYAVECGTILGLGGAFFAAITAVGALSKEENGRTAEFLLTHPLGRGRIVTNKLIAVLIQVVILNVAVFALSAASMLAVGEEIPWRDICLLHGANFLMQVELAGICFGMSAFLRHSGLGAGLGLAVTMYFLNLVANISPKAEFLKYITPFGYTDGADIVSVGRLDGVLVAIGMAFAAAGIAAAYWKYANKDIH